MTPAANAIHLRALEPEDLALMYRIENLPSFWDSGAATVPYSRYALREYITTAHNDLFLDGQVRLVIEAGTTAVGFADLVNLDTKHLRAEISLAILPEYQGQHIGHRAIEALCDYARRLRLHQIYAVIAVTNTPASHLFRSLGFSPTATLTDWLFAGDTYVSAVVWQQRLTP